MLRLTDEELDRFAERLRAADVRVSAIGSPIGKVGVRDDFGAHLEDFARAIAVARRLGTGYIRVFSFFIPEGDDPAAHRDEALARMKELAARAEAAGVTLLHENERRIYGDVPERCADILETCASPALKAAFDPANFVQCGVRPFARAWPLLAPHVEYAHIKDARFADGSVTPAGQGDAEVPALLAALRDRGYAGFLSLEPHLASGGMYSGFSGPGLFKTAVRALKSLLAEAGIAYH